MGVRIRLARFGRKKLPFYRLYVADSRCRRDGKHIEILGWYDPLSGAKDGVKRFSVKTERAKYWLSVGAQPTETAARILRKAEVLPDAPIASVAKEMGADLAAKAAPSSQSQSTPVVKAVLATSRPMHNQVQMARSFVALPVLRCGCLW